MKVTLSLSVPPSISFDASPEEIIGLPVDALKVLTGTLIKLAGRVHDAKDGLILDGTKEETK